MVSTPRLYRCEHEGCDAKVTEQGRTFVQHRNGDLGHRYLCARHRRGETS